MLIRGRNDGTIEFLDIEPIEVELIREIVPLADSGDSQPDNRLFPPPAAETETEFLRDWAEFVEPELRRLFLSARTVVKEDIDHLQSPRGGHGRLKIRAEHGEAWLNTLNQVRLVLADRYNFTERELSSHKVPRAFTKRELVLVQINFYAAVQERIIELLEGRSLG